MHDSLGRAWPFLPENALIACCRHLIFLRWHELEERAAKVLSALEHGAIVVELVAVVGSTEDGHQLLLGEELIAILLYLMPAHDQIQFMLDEELLYDLIRENETDAAVIFAPFLRHEVEDEW